MEMLRQERDFNAGFVERNKKRWKKGFDLLETLIHISHESGEQFCKENRRAATKKNDFRLYVLMRLHARSCLISREILTLMSNGFADGAFARWRTLYEIAVTAMFLSTQPSEVSEMYLAHESTERNRAAEEFQKHCKDLGHKPINKREMSRIKKELDATLSRFKSKFDHQYGWAAKAVGKNACRFVDIEDAVQMGRMRPYYRLASFGVHAGPHGLHSYMGMSDADQEMALAGPSDGGMADPGHATAIALTQIATALISLKPNLEAVVISKIMLRLTDKIGKAFLNVHKAKKRSTKSNH
jgi:hypothetical protein